MPYTGPVEDAIFDIRLEINQAVVLMCKVFLYCSERITIQTSKKRVFAFAWPEQACPVTPVVESVGFKVDQTIPLI